MPLAIEQLNLAHYDLVLSSSHCVAKGVLTGPDQLHISYVHTPMRYAWDLQHEYLAGSRLRPWDQGLVRPLDAAQAADVGCTHGGRRRLVRGQQSLSSRGESGRPIVARRRSSIRRSIPKPFRCRTIATTTT